MIAWCRRVRTGHEVHLEYGGATLLRRANNLVKYEILYILIGLYIHHDMLSNIHDDLICVENNNNNNNNGNTLDNHGNEETMGTSMTADRIGI